MTAQKMRNITFAQAVRTAIREEMKRDEKVILFGEDVGQYGGVYGATTGLQREFGEDRVRDTPISEMAIAGMAVGAALAGYRPIAEIMYVDFLAHAADAIVNNAAKWRYMSGEQFRLPLVVRSPARRRGRRLCGAAFPEPGGMVHPHSGPQGRHAGAAPGCAGPAEGGHPR